MNKILDVFYEMHCLTEQSARLSGIALQKKWFKSADKRIIGQYLQKFVEYNFQKFQFLGVQAYITGADQNISLSFRSSEFIGAIPLRTSDTGKQIGDFVVTPRFIGCDRFEDYIEILDLLGTEISPERFPSLPLASGRNFRPPLYLEAVKFVSALEQLVKIPWRKFDTIQRDLSHPSGLVNWNAYIKQGFKIENTLKFPTRKNILSEFHKEFSELRYVFDICKIELLSSNTPLKIKSGVQSRLAFLGERLYMHKPLQTIEIAVKPSDNYIITSCKTFANNVLSHNFSDSIAWRVDFSIVFEKLIQYIFKELARETGGKLFSNFRFHSKTSKHYSWELNHIEPDAIYQKDNVLVFIDAKYKSHLYNKFDISDKLKEDYRHDLHQIMAYSSFSKTEGKFSFLCYPSDCVEVKKIAYKNRINGITNTVYLLGVPLKASIVNQVKALLINAIEEIGHLDVL